MCSAEHPFLVFKFDYLPLSIGIGAKVYAYAENCIRVPRPGTEAELHVVDVDHPMDGGVKHLL